MDWQYRARARTYDQLDHLGDLIGECWCLRRKLDSVKLWYETGTTLLYKHECYKLYKILNRRDLTFEERYLLNECIQQHYRQLEEVYEKLAKAVN